MIICKTQCLCFLYPLQRDGDITSNLCMLISSVASSFPSQGTGCLNFVAVLTQHSYVTGQGTAKVKEGAVRCLCLGPLFLVLGGTFKLFPWRMPSLCCRSACTWHCTVLILSLSCWPWPHSCFITADWVGNVWTVTLDGYCHQNTSANHTVGSNSFLVRTLPSWSSCHSWLPVVKPSL